MVNQAYLDDKKIKDILTYISGMRHSEQIRQMFFCSLNGMRSVNFCYLQIKDVYNEDGCKRTSKKDGSIRYDYKDGTSVTVTKDGIQHDVNYVKEKIG